MHGSSQNSKSYETAAILYSIGGLSFIIAGIASGKIGVFLPIGIGLVVIGLGCWRKSHKPADSSEEASEGDAPPRDN